MLNIKRRAQKQQAQVIEAPYKRTKPSMPVAENVENAIAQFGNVYEMVLATAKRSKELLNGGRSTIDGHKPTVTAILEVEAGIFDKQKYLSQVGRRNKRPPQ